MIKTRGYSVSSATQILTFGPLREKPSGFLISCVQNGSGEATGTLEVALTGPNPSVAEVQAGDPLVPSGLVIQYTFHESISQPATWHIGLDPMDWEGKYLSVAITDASGDVHSGLVTLF